MRIIVTRDRSSEPVAAFSLAGAWPLLAVVAVAVFAASVYFGARALAGYWAQSGHPVLAEVVRERLAENESERRALLRETVRLQNGAVADLQVRLWQLRQRAAIAAETLNLPPDLFAAGDSLLTGVGGDDIRPVLCEGFPEDDAGGSGDNDTVGTGGDVFQNGGVFKNNNGAEDADVFAAAADLGDSLSALESELSRTAAGLDAVERRAAGVAVLRRTIPMERPVAGKHWRTSMFGYRKDPFTGRRAFHSGYDYAARVGVPVVAGADGVVVYGGRLGNYGKAIQIYHGGGVSTLYGHLSEMTAERWSFVRKGDVIGAVGNTGRSTGPHLHYEVRFDNRPQPVRRAIRTLQKERGI